MKSLLLICACLMLVACQGNTQQQTNLKSTKDSISYSLGMDIGKNIKAQKLDVDAAIIAKGLQDYVDSAHLMMTVEQSLQVLASWRTEMMKKQQAEAAVLGEKNKKDGDSFLAANKTKEGVVTTASGLQYKIIKQGTGPKPTAEKTVSVHYRGTLLDGTEVDNSYKRNEPYTTSLHDVMPGWTEGLQLMPVGSKYQFFIPSELGYGERGRQGLIPPNSVLIFEVELLQIMK